MALTKKEKALTSRAKGSFAYSIGIGRRFGSTGYVVYVDVKSFFDSIPNDVALREIAKRAPDPFALRFCKMAMDAHSSPVGMGLGSELSQLTGLTVLDGVDHVAKELCHARFYTRYMDDSVAVFNTKEEANRYLDAVKQELTVRGLKASPKKTLIFQLKQGITYLGWRYILKPNGRIICKPRKGKVSKLKRKVRRMKRAGVPLDTIVESFRDSVASLKWGDAKKEIRTLNKFFKEEIQNEGCQVSR